MYNIITNICMINIHKHKQLFGLRDCLSNILNKGYIVINIKDYNSMSTGVL